MLQWKLNTLQYTVMKSSILASLEVLQQKRILELYAFFYPLRILELYAFFYPLGILELYAFFLTVQSPAHSAMDSKSRIVPREFELEHLLSATYKTITIGCLCVNIKLLKYETLKVHFAGSTKLER